MYFKDRSTAGRLLAEQLYDRYRYENCAVVALSDGAVLVAEQIAGWLHCALTMLIAEDIEIPGESLSLGAVSQEGDFTYNSMFTSGEIQGYVSEYHGYLEEQKRQKFQRINRLLGDGGVIDRDMLRDQVVILVSDGLNNDSSLDVAIDFMKPIRIQRLVIASPTASLGTIDKIHMLADELHILDVKENFMGVNHYYEHNEIPSHEETIARINQMILNWR